MMKLIDEAGASERRFGVGHFDLIVIDEAHRSVYRKYKAIFDYFDSYLVGLTATPKGEVDRDTYRLFDLETGVPTDAYGLDEAVRDKHLVPPRVVSLTTDFLDRGISYGQLSEEDKEKWDALEWDEEGSVPAAVEAPAMNKWLFNADTVDRVLEHLMREGLKVEDGDRLGKTIIFAKNREHANFIAQRFDVAYPHYAGHFARTIDYSISYAQSLIDDFSDSLQGAAYRHLGRHARHRHRRAGGREPRLLQAGALEDQILADDRARHAPLQRPVRAGQGQVVLLLSSTGAAISSSSTRTPAQPTAPLSNSLTKRLFDARVEIIGEIDKARPAAEPDRPFAQPPPAVLHAGEKGSKPEREWSVFELRGSLAA